MQKDSTVLATIQRFMYLGFINTYSFYENLLTKAIYIHREFIKKILHNFYLNESKNYEYVENRSDRTHVCMEMVC